MHFLYKRRDFITLLGGAAAAWPLTVRGQQAGKVWRIGVLETISPELNAANFDALRRALRNLGYIQSSRSSFRRNAMAIGGGSARRTSAASSSRRDSRARTFPRWRVAMG
jgi:hypothetical protein